MKYSEPLHKMNTSCALALNKRRTEKKQALFAFTRIYLTGISSNMLCAASMLTSTTAFEMMVVAAATAAVSL
jgi:hypothetical protein